MMKYTNQELTEMVEKFREDGYLIIGNAISPQEVSRINQAVDETVAREEESLSYNLYNCVTCHPVLADLMEHPAILPLVVHMLGSNIQLFISNLTIRKPNKDAIQSKSFDFTNWHQDGPTLGFPQIDGLRPLMYVRVGIILSDLSEPDRGNTKVIPGSHKIPFYQPESSDVTIPNKDEVQICGKPGDIFFFGQNTWHAGAPNRSSIERRMLIYGYGYMWLRPNDYVKANPHQLERISSIRRQLLGEIKEGLLQPGGEDKERDDVLDAMQYWNLGKFGMHIKDLPLSSLLCKPNS